MKVCQERIFNSSTARCLWIAEKCKEAKFIMLKHYCKLDKNQMNKQEMKQLVNNNMKYKTWHQAIWKRENYKLARIYVIWWLVVKKIRTKLSQANGPHGYRSSYSFNEMTSDSMTKKTISMMINDQKTMTNETPVVMFERGKTKQHPWWDSMVSACLLYTTKAQNPS